MEKRILSKTAPQHGGRVARNVCFSNWKTEVVRLLVSLLHSFVRRSQHVPARMARKCCFSLWESIMCTKLAFHAQVREAQAAFGKAWRKPAQSKVLLS
jgi:hypothetical protein